jgi:uncharacterized protein YukE
VTLSVDLVALNGLSDLLDRAYDDADAAGRYSWDETDLNLTGDGLINLLTGGHLEARRGVTMWLGEVRDRALGNTGAAVRDALGHYRGTDGASAERLDRTLPGADATEVRGDLPASTPVMGPVAPSMYFTDLAEPQHAMRTPQDYNDELPYTPSFTGLASPFELIRVAIYRVTEFAAFLGICDRSYDIAEVVLKPLVGDWAGLRACADVHRDTGEAVEQIGRNVLKAVDVMPDAWRGNAADACRAHLARVAKALLDSKAQFEALAKEYEGAAKGAHELSGAAGNLLNDIGDAALTAAASGTITAAAGSTGWGLPAAVLIGGIALTKTYRVVHGIAEILKEISRMQMYISGINASIEGLGRVDSHLTLPPVPSIDRSALPTGTRR